MPFVTLITLFLNAPPAAALFDSWGLESKGGFERGRQVLVWDEGAVEGFVDGGDFIVDLTVPCAVDPLTLNQASGRPERIAAVVEADGKNQLNALGITSPIHMNIVSSFRGRSDQPTALIFPEVHLTTDASPNTKRLHERAALDLLTLTEDVLAGGKTVINFREGPFGRPRVKRFTTPVDSRAARDIFARTQQARFMMSGAFLLAEAFGDRLPYIAVDDDELLLKNVIVDELLGSWQTRPTFRRAWPRLREYLNSNFAERVAAVPARSLRPFVKSLWRKTSAEIKREAVGMCERRSVVMAEQTLAELDVREASVALISVGAFHVHGIAETLRARGVGYLVLSPNF